MFDLLDILHGRQKFVFTGSYYSILPNALEDEHALFDYEHIDPAEWHYQKLLGNVINSDGATTTIKSNDDMNWKIDKYVVLQDMKLYKIVNIMKEYTSSNKEVFRFLKDAPEINYVIRLQEMDNPWELN